MAASLSVAANICGEALASDVGSGRAGAPPMIDGWQMANLRGRTAGTRVFTSAVATFVLSGVIATAALAIGGVVLIQRTGHNEAIRDAKELSQFAGQGIVAPVLSDGVLKGNPADVARLDRMVRAHVIQGSIVRVKIWSPTGEILYSDDHQLIGQTFALGDDELAILRNGGVAADVSDLSKPENRLDRRYKKLLEVYLPIETTSGAPVLFETYSVYRSIAASGRRVWLAFAPAIIGALLLLELVQVPLALQLARRLQQSQRDREDLLRRAIQASDLERRRIAHDLHDGPVQDLAGISYSLAAAADSTADPKTVAPLREGADAARRSVRNLRGILVEIYPPDLQRAGLAAALADTVAPFAASGITARVDVPDDLEVAPAVEAMLFRVAQEALRNVRAHAHATEVTVKAGHDDGVAWITVIDNGRGFDKGAAGDRSFGLRLLRDLLTDASGTIEITSEPGVGTALRAEVPSR